MNLTTKKNWKTVKLGDLVAKVIDNRGKTPPIVESGLALLEVNAITEKSRFPEYNLVKKFVDQNTHDTWFRTGHIKKGDIIIPTVGTIGNVAVSLEDRGSIAQNLIALRFKEQNDSLFLYYLLKTPTFKKQIFNLDIGGVQPSVKVPHLLDSEIKIPESIDEQREIAGVLGCLDDKIELLRKENKTLEEMAQTLFKEWFVNFNFPGATGKMIDSELGKIPEGWRVGKLGEVLVLEYGKALKEEERTGTGFPVIGSSGIVGKHRDFLVRGDGIVVGRKGTMGSVIWIEDNFYPIDTTFYVVDKLGVDKMFFHYLLLKNQNLTSVGSGSAVPGLNRNAAYSIEFVLPKVGVVEVFNQTIEPVFSKLKNNHMEIQTLSKLRDELLNKIFNV